MREEYCVVKRKEFYCHIVDVSQVHNYCIIRFIISFICASLAYMGGDFILFVSPSRHEGVWESKGIVLRSVALAVDENIWSASRSSIVQ